MSIPELRVALLGCGVVGGHVAARLMASAEEFEGRVGARLKLVGIAVRDTSRPRETGVDPSLLTTDAESLVGKADIVIELMGGIEPARSLILRALDSGASVVTANKALLAEHGAALRTAADDAGVQLEYEAAVAGAIPIVRPLGDSLAGDSVNRILGIVNGTTNYVLDKMDSTGLSQAEAVASAQQLGFAEADPTADVEGYDAAAKAALLASLAFHTTVELSDVHREGITAITADAVANARTDGYVIKLLTVCERVHTPSGPAIRSSVYPALLPLSHPLAGVRGAFNAVYVESEAAGELMFYGQGAGGAPTSSAVLGDVISVARRRLLGGRGQATPRAGALRLLPMSEIRTRYHVVLDVVDKPGVLAQVTEVFAAKAVSIETVRQSVRSPLDDPDDGALPPAGRAKLVIATHAATNGALDETVASLGALDSVHAVVSTLRMEGA